MNRVRWIAWGVIELEKLERMQRRNYIKKIREELTPLGIKFESGGVSNNPFYRVIIVNDKGKTHAAAGPDAAKNACAWLLMELGEHERSEDGGVRGAGDEAPGYEGPGVGLDA